MEQDRLVQNLLAKDYGALIRYSQGCYWYRLPHQYKRKWQRIPMVVEHSAYVRTKEERELTK